MSDAHETVDGRSCSGLVGRDLRTASGSVAFFARVPSAVLQMLQARDGSDSPDAWVTLGRFRDDHRAEGNWLGSSGILIDLDWEDPAVPKEEGAHQAIPEAERRRILDALDEHVVPGFAYLTPRGVRWGCVLSEDVTGVEEYRELAEAAADRLLDHIEDLGVPMWRRGVTGLRFDTASLRPSQAMRRPLPGMETCLTGADRPAERQELLGDGVPRLPLADALPDALPDAFRQIGSWIQVPQEVVVTCFMSLASAAIGCTRWVTARGLAVPLSLHYLTVLGSGAGKSTVRSFLRRATKRIEEQILARREEARREREDYEDLLAVWKADRKSSRRRDSAGPRPQPPALPPSGGERVTYILSEGTLVGVIATLEDTPRGILWASDEAHEILGLLGQYSEGNSARSVDAARLRRLTESQPIEAHRGRSNLSSIRRLPRPWLALDADVQPGLFQKIFDDEDLLSGLTARILVHEAVDPRGRRHYVEPPAEPDAGLLDYLGEVLYRLWRIPLALEDGVPQYAPLPLSPGADRLWAEEMERLERRYFGASEEEAGHLSHLRGRLLRLSGVLALLRNPQAPQVEAEDMRRAVVHARYHLEHHRRLFGSVDEERETRRLERLRESAEKLFEQQREKGVRPADLRKRVSRSRYEGEGGRQRAVADLHAIGWVLRRPRHEGGSGRPPVPAFFPRSTPNASPKPPKPRDRDAEGGLGGLGDGSRGTAENNGFSSRELLERASRALLDRREVILPPPGKRTRCPICGSSDGLGVIPDSPERWYCHSDRHQAGGCAVDLHLGEQLGRQPSTVEAKEHARGILAKGARP